MSGKVLAVVVKLRRLFSNVSRFRQAGSWPMEGKVVGSVDEVVAERPRFPVPTGRGGPFILR